MSKKQRIANRKCSAILAVGTGAAVCLTGGGPAHAVTGNVAASNGANSVFGANSFYSAQFNLFSGKISPWLLVSTTSSTVQLFANTTFNTNWKNSGSFISAFASGVTVSAGLGLSSYTGRMQSNQSNKYLAFKFDDSGTKYGWVQLISSNAFGNIINLGTWSYNGSGGSIKTLSNSVTTSRLGLTDGQEKLHWSNDNEQGVARYEVQSQDDAGNWQTADSDVPGNGSYSAKVAAGATSRLVIEMTDGTTKEIDF